MILLKKIDMNYSDIDTLYSFSDGDVITPSMGVSIAAGHSLAQFYDPTTKRVSADSTFATAANQPVLYPLPYSSKKGVYVVPDSVGQQWYYNNLQVENAGILDASGNVKPAYAKLFQKTTYSLNGKSYPAIKIIGDLCSETDQSNKTIYYVGMVNGVQVVCKVDIPINVTTGSPYNVVVNCVNSSGENDCVMDVDGEFLTLTSQLNTGNSPVSGAKHWWEKLEGDTWIKLTTAQGKYTISSDGRTLKVEDAGVQGIENFRSVAQLGSAQYVKVIALSDTRDPFFIDKGRSTASNCIRESESVTYAPKVYSRSTQELQSGWSFAYLATKPDGSVLESKTGASYSISGSVISQHGSVTIAITASKA